MFPIKVKGLSFGYDDQLVLKNISTEFERGKLTSVIGPNGSGKTTFIKHLSRLFDSEKGKIQLLDKDLHDYSHKEISRIVAIVPQTTTIEFDYSVEDVVMMGRYPHLKRFQLEGSHDHEVVAEALMATDVFHLRHKSINALSGGELQRVIIARALAQEPQILVLDEPISHLDIHHQIELLRMVRKLSEEKGLTVIMILHDLNFAMDFSDHVVMLKSGEIYAEGTPQEVITPESVEAVYNIQVSIITNPNTGNPHIIPKL